MRPTNFPLFVLLLAAGSARAQPPAEDKVKPPPDEYKVLVSVVTEAYKAPHEVDNDVLDELRRLYRDPTPKREEKILREVRRLYVTTPDHEEAIVREVRAAVANPTPDQEARVFAVIGRNGRLPPGTIPTGELAIRAGKLFARFDRDRNKVLDPDEMPDALRAEVRRWDQNRDGGIDATEYATYYREQLSQVSAKVASGEIVLKLPKGVAVPPPESVPPPPVPDEPPAVAVRYGKLPPGLPAWFAELDEDRDGQVGLYEWRKAGRPTAEFVAMDLNGDGLLPADEYLRYARTAAPPATAAAPAAKSARPMRGM